MSRQTKPVHISAAAHKRGQRIARQAGISFGSLVTDLLLASFDLIDAGKIQVTKTSNVVGYKGGGKK